MSSSPPCAPAWTPNGYALDGDRMPWRAIGKMDDEELGAIYAYLKRLPDSPNVAAH